MAGQIVKTVVLENGDFVLQVRPFDSPKLSSTGETLQVAGTIGWAENIGVNYICPVTKETVSLTASVSIRYANPAKSGAKKAKAPVKPLTMDDLIAAANKQSKPNVPAK